MTEPIAIQGVGAWSTFVYLHVHDDGRPIPEMHRTLKSEFTWFEVADDEGVIVRVDEQMEVEWIGTKERLRAALLRWYTTQNRGLL